MEKLSCIIIDDEPLALDLLSDYVARTPFLEYKGGFTHAPDALPLLQQQQVQLIFLDVQMPAINGLQFLRILPHRPHVILTTAYPEYALDGFELDVADYLLKPIRYERFLKAVSKVLASSQPATPSPPSVPVPAASENTPVADGSIFVKTDHRIVRISLDDILFIQSLKEYVMIHTVQGKTMTLQSLKRMEDVLPPGQFIRIHKSYLIALSRIDMVEGNRVVIGKEYIPIGDTYKAAFLAHLNRTKLL